MLRLLGHIASAGSAELVSNATRIFVRALPRSLSRAGARREYLGEFRKQLFKFPDRQPRLSSIFILAAVWGTTPLDILLRPREVAAPNLFVYDTDIPVSPPVRAIPRDGYRRCEQRLLELMKLPRTILLPPAIHICREFRVSTNFQLRCANVWKAYIEDKNRRLRNHKEKTILLANRFMETHIAKLRQNSVLLHRRNAIAQAVRELSVPYAVARSALRVALFNARRGTGDPREASTRH